MTRTSIRPQVSAALAEVWLRILNISRYPGEIFMEIVTPIVLAAVPLLLGRSAGPQAVSNFEANVGTANCASVATNNAPYAISIMRR